MKKPAAWIDVVSEHEAEGPLAEIYDRIKDKDTGHVDNILKIHSLHPETLDDHLVLYRRLMFGTSKLKRAEREMLAVVVSSINECHY